MNYTAIMNIHSNAPTDPDAFLRWNEGREGKRELVRGTVVEMMTGATRGHAILVSELSAALRGQIDRTRFLVVTSDLGVTTPLGVRYPDLVVDRKGGANSGLAAIGPVLIAEVLSPSSTTTDLVEKSAEYTSLAGLRYYLVLAQAEPRAWLWSGDSGEWVGPDLFEGLNARVELAALGAALSLRTLYDELLSDDQSGL